MAQVYMAIEPEFADDDSYAGEQVKGAIRLALRQVRLAIPMSAISSDASRVHLA